MDCAPKKEEENSGCSVLFERPLAGRELYLHGRGVLPPICLVFVCVSVKLTREQDYRATLGTASQRTMSPRPDTSPVLRGFCTSQRRGAFVVDIPAILRGLEAYCTMLHEHEYQT